jgi:hypothetical protein
MATRRAGFVPTSRALPLRTFTGARVPIFRNCEEIDREAYRCVEWQGDEPVRFKNGVCGIDSDFWKAVPAVAGCS